MELDKTSEVVPLITTEDAALLAQAIAYAQQVHEEEIRSGAAVEAKATTLIAALGIVATLLAGAGGLLLDQVRQATSCWLVSVLFGAAFAAAGVCLFLALRHSLAALQVAPLARPSPTTFLNLQASPFIELQRQQLAALLVSQNKNRAANDGKAENLAQGYLFLWGTAISLLVVAGTMVGYALWLEFR